MHARTIIGGLLLVMGLLSTGCGGVEVEEKGAVQSTGKTQQAESTCPPGYTEVEVWQCEEVCGLHNGNVLRAYCVNESGWIDAGAVTYDCSDPC